MTAADHRRLPGFSLRATPRGNVTIGGSVRVNSNPDPASCNEKKISQLIITIYIYIYIYLLIKLRARG